MKILVVEDDRAIAEVVVQLLANYNYAADTAVDGLAGLAMAEAFEYDLVILDIGLPRLDGIEVCKRLRERYFGNPILLLSGSESSQNKAIALKELRAKLTAVGAPKDFIKTVHRVGYQLNLLYAADLGKRLTAPQVVELAVVNEELRGAIAQLRSTQDTLRAREEHYRLLSEISPVGIFRNDPSGACTYVNERTAQLLGIPAIDCLGNKWMKTLHPDEIQWVYAAWQDFIARSQRVPFGESTGAPTTIHSFECRHLHRDGEVVWVLVNIVPECDRTGTITGYMGTLTDITARKQAEARWQRAAELDAFRVMLGDTLRSIADPIEIQVAACRLLGEHLGVDRAYYVEVNEVEGYARVDRNYLRGDSLSIVGTFRLVDYGWTLPLLKRGETIIVVDVENSDIIPAAERAAMAAVSIAAHISFPIIKEGALMGALCVTEPMPRQWSEIDVELVGETAERIWGAISRARNETALRESESKFRTMTELVPALLWQLDPSGQAIDWNPSWLDYTGQTSAESQDDGWIAAIHPEDRPHTGQIFEAAYAAQQELEVQHRIRRHDGEYRWFAVRQIPIRDERGTVVQWFGAALDIQEQHITQAALGASAEQLRAFVSATSDLVYEMSADWREMRFLEGKEFLATTENSRRDWTEGYIPEADRAQVWAHIDRAISTRSNFELEHRAIGWTAPWAGHSPVPFPCSMRQAKSSNG